MWFLALFLAASMAANPNAVGNIEHDEQVRNIQSETMIISEERMTMLPVNSWIFNKSEYEKKESAEEHILELLGGTKLFNEAKTWYDEAPDDSLFEANIVLNFEVDTSNFENKLLEVFGDSIVYQKIHDRRYYMVINKKQADQLQAMEEVLLIASANEKMHVNVPDWNPLPLNEP